MKLVFKYKDISESIFDHPGYSTDLVLTSEELYLFRLKITQSWLNRIESCHPELVDQFTDVGIQNYHNLSHLLEHEKMWDKNHRTFNEVTVKKIKSLPFMKNLEKAFGKFSISDVVSGNNIDIGREEIYWRIVRPHKTADVGPIHADKWFHAAVGGGKKNMFDLGSTTVKIWIPIYCEPGLNGLTVVPDSHLKDWSYHLVVKDGVSRPQIDEDLKSLNPILLKTSPGTLVIFNERLLHGGAVNYGETTRVSIEITMVFNSR